MGKAETLTNINLRGGLMKVNHKYKITQPEEHFLDQDNQWDSFSEVTRLVRVLRYVASPNGNSVLVECLNTGEVYPFPIEDIYLVEEIL